jgi:hypothetical protein
MYKASLKGASHMLAKAVHVELTLQGFIISIYNMSMCECVCVRKTLRQLIAMFMFLT